MTPDQIAQLNAARNSEPDLEEFPEAPAENWAKARRGPFAMQRPINIQLDPDVLDWLQRKHDRYQVEVNRILRERMEAESAATPPP